MDRTSACWNSSSFVTSVALTSAARPAVRFWLQAITFIPKALPICATAPPTLPRPDDVERPQALDDRLGIREMVVEHRHHRSAVQYRPGRERKSDVLVIVKDSNSEAFVLGGHCVSPEVLHPFVTRPTGRLPSGRPRRTGRH